MKRPALLPVATLLCLYVLPVAANADGLGQADSEDVGLSTERLQRIEETIGLEIEGSKKAGAAVLIARRGKIAYLKAFGRGELVRHLLTKEWAEDLEDDTPLERRFPHYVINWSIFQLRHQPPFPMPNPFKTYVQEVRNHLAEPQKPVLG